jgi:hypothetical protein
MCDAPKKKAAEAAFFVFNRASMTACTVENLRHKQRGNQRILTVMHLATFA